MRASNLQRMPTRWALRWSMRGSIALLICGLTFIMWIASAVGVVWLDVGPQVLVHAIKHCCSVHTKRHTVFGHQTSWAEVLEHLATLPGCVRRCEGGPHTSLLYNVLVVWSGSLCTSSSISLRNSCGLLWSFKPHAVCIRQCEQPTLVVNSVYTIV